MDYQLVKRIDEEDRYEIKYTKVIKDVDGNDVTIVDRIEVITLNDLQAQKNEYQKQIDELQIQINEVDLKIQQLNSLEE